MIDHHIETLTKKAQGIETRLFETQEDLPADKLMPIVDELYRTVGALNFLLQVKAAKNPSPIIKMGKQN